MVPANSKKLTRSDGSRTIGMTDANTMTIYLYRGLSGALLDKVLAHELVHVFMFSYGLEIDIDLEEYMADFISIYGRDIIYLLDDLLYQNRKRAQ